MELKEMYPKAFENVMKGNLRFSFDSLPKSMQEQTLRDITGNL
jgi:hypothetical protein